MKDVAQIDVMGAVKPGQRVAQQLILDGEVNRPGQSSHT